MIIKEITAIIRMDMYDKTKEALLSQGFASMHSRKVMGRGKKKVSYELSKDTVTGGIFDSHILAEQLSAEHRLMPKRMLVLIVNDKDVSTIVDTIIRVNKTGNPGNGKIFIATVKDAVRVRTSEIGTEAI